MKVYKNGLLLVLFCLGNVFLAHSHALYIDTNLKGELGQEHQVKVYYSEFADQTNEKLADWFSDVRQFDLWLVHPDGHREKLPTTARDSYVGASFTPHKEGVYRLLISHITKDVPKETAFQFNTSAKVRVGATPTAAEIKTADFVIVQQKIENNPSVRKLMVYFKGNPKPGVEVSVYSPSGKINTLTTDENGSLKIKLNQQGTYFLEATMFQQDKPGETAADSYKKLWRCATLKLEHNA